MEKYYNEDFRDFKNKGFLIRGRDQIGNLIIFVATDLKKAHDEGPYIIKIDKKTGEIKHTSFHLMSDSSNIDTLLIQKLIPLFLRSKDSGKV